ncbi:hypothetical protein [Priestia megaterium]|uniref:hypothetical protein n=1 Tax=Priestia megaterium TaxID=1404 RepID=UPI0024530AAE|nr:hypothetical protein [Priestia megaterium]MDH3155952.1 hypothetical protein [Priestia megaterium]MED4116345.1 hypothetical protein [Priestia megaterium]
MKKILAFISIILTVGVLASCENEKTSTEPKSKTCEQIETCKLALDYTTAVEKGAALKVYKYEAKGENDLHVYDSKKEAEESIPSDYRKYKNNKIEDYGVAEYTIQRKQSYLYKFKYNAFRKNEDGVRELTTLIVHVYKEGGKYYPIEVFDYPELKEIKGDKELDLPQIYYSSNLTSKEKVKFKPKSIEGE